MKSGKNQKTWSVVLVSALASLLAACAAPGDDGTAGTELGGDDQTASQPQEGPQVLIAPPAPDGASTAVDHDKGAGSQFAVAPTISPGTEIEDAVPGGTYSCASGNFCAGVWNPTIGKWRVFKLFNCTRYSVSNWIGSGFYFDNQTGNPATKVFGQNGAQLNPPGNIFPGPQQNIDWNPVFSIRNC